MEEELISIEFKRWKAIKSINNMEYRLDSLRQITEPLYVREKLQNWIDRIINAYDRLPDGRYCILIPLNRWHPRLINEIDTATLRKIIIEELRDGNLLMLFQNDHDNLHANDITISLWVNDQEYEDILPAMDERPWFILCGIRIIRDKYTQYGEYVISL